MKNEKRGKTGPGPKRILIVDDHPMMRQGLMQLIESERDLVVCGEAENAGQALERAGQLKPDLLLADISLPGKNGLELIKDLQSTRSSLPVLIISMHDEMLYGERVLRAGGRGYIMKQEGGKKIMEAIRQVLSGKVFVSEKMSSQILENLTNRSPRPTRSPVERLTDREFEVFQLIGQGLSTREIAGQLHLSSKTVEVHRINIKQKLNLKTATELIRFAVRWVESAPNEADTDGTRT
jgi:DNA-binding NarL/FixJ family response regulator